MVGAIHREAIMKRRVPLIAMLILPACAAAAGAASAQAPTSTAAKIANAMSAAPRSISANATILDWPATEGAKPAVLRAGSNGWVCYPDMPMSEGNDPSCLDSTWQSWADALTSRTAPKTDRVGVAYMIAPGGAWGSNTDPYATERTAENEWGFDPPHLMILVPDLKTLEGVPSSRENGGPYVMFRGTPYAHVMVPVAQPPAP
jgi:hypothetical protein